MNSAQRAVKQLVALIIFLVILGGLGLGFYKASQPSVPTPTPVQSPLVSPLEVISSKIFNIANNDYDFLAKVRNPNQGHGSSAVNYEIVFFDAAGQVVFTKVGNFYILPGQTKYIADLPIRLERPAVRHELKIKSAEWIKLDQFTLSDLDLFVGEVDYSEPAGQAFFARLAGDITNNSDFDLNRIDAVIVIISQTGEIIAVNKTSINTFLAKTKRGFEVRWARPFVGNFGRAEVEVYTNIFDNSNYIRRLGDQEKFQQFY